MRGTGDMISVGNRKASGRKHLPLVAEVARLWSYKPISEEIGYGKDWPGNECRSRSRKTSGGSGKPRSLATLATHKCNTYFLAMLSRHLPLAYNDAR